MRKGKEKITSQSSAEMPHPIPRGRSKGSRSRVNKQAMLVLLSLFAFGIALVYFSAKTVNSVVKAAQDMGRLPDGIQPGQHLGFRKGGGNENDDKRPHQAEMNNLGMSEAEQGNFPRWLAQLVTGALPHTVP